MTIPRKKLLPGLFLVALATLLAAGCRQEEPPEKPDSDLAPAELHGKKLFVTRCAACHEAHSTKPFHGPGMAGLMRRQYLPSGAPANDERVRQVIVHGRNTMPAFGNFMDDRQIDDVIAYLHTL